MPLQWHNQFWQSLEEGARASLLSTYSICSPHRRTAPDGRPQPPGVGVQCGGGGELHPEAHAVGVPCWGKPVGAAVHHALRGGQEGQHAQAVPGTGHLHAGAAHQQLRSDGHQPGRDLPQDHRGRLPGRGK